MTSLIQAAVLAIGFLLPMNAVAEDNMLIHEWGTFTSLQDEQGQTIGGINVDDEALPGFVHRLAPLLLKHSDVPPSIYGYPCYAKGVPAAHPDITMRLETPVVYFYLPKSNPTPVTLDFTVSFQGGWLTEFYPAAEAIAPGLVIPAFRQDDFYKAVQGDDAKPVRPGQVMGSLDASTLGKLKWKNITVGGEHAGPNTTSRVWTAPRAVQAASIKIKNEAEKFLFYRGVGHVRAPLRVVRDEKQDELLVHSQLDAPIDQTMEISQMWLTEIRTDGSVAFHSFGRIALTGNADVPLANIPASFPESNFSSTNIDQLRSSMHKTLVQEGLFADEADALLNTWEVSYFKSAGLRLFFIVPPAWTDQKLPLQVSVPAQITRVMIGRIELKTPRQQVLLDQIAAGSPLKICEFHRTIREMPAATRKAYVQAHRAKAASATDIPVPDEWLAYLDLGRFRNALVLHEYKRRKWPNLSQFIQSNGLQAPPPAQSRPALSLSFPP